MNLDAITSFPRHLFITGGKELDIRFVQIIDATFHQAALMFSTCRSRHFRSIPSASSSVSRAEPWESAGRRSAGSWPRTRSADARRAQRRGRTSSAAERPWLEKKHIRSSTVDSRATYKNLLGEVGLLPYPRDCWPPRFLSPSLDWK